MESKRQLKYARMIQKELGNMFQADTKSLFDNAFITVTHMEISPDLSVAKAYLSFLLVPDKKATLISIQEKSKVIRQMLANKIRNQVRIIPELVFYLDDSAEYAVKMDNLISNLNKVEEIQPNSKPI